MTNNKCGIAQWHDIHIGAARCGRSKSKIQNWLTQMRFCAGLAPSK